MNYENLDKHFEKLHNMDIKGFNPDYIPYAVDVSTIVTYNLHKEGFYKNFTLKERQESNKPKLEYDRLMKLGKPDPNLVKIAKEYLYNLD